MEEKKRVFIADHDAEVCTKLTAILQSYAQVEVLGAVQDGTRLLARIRQTQPDIVITDALLPEKDGLSVIRAMQQDENLSKKPVVFLLSHFISAAMSSEASMLGVQYITLKPCDLQALALRVAQFDLAECVFAEQTQEISPALSLELRVTDMLHVIGIPANLKGYQYLRDAIQLAVNDSGVLGGITKILYPTVAKHYNTSSDRVERAIRHAIASAWDRVDGAVLSDYFVSQRKPTNSEFIAVLADRLQLERKQETR